ncbi:MAG: restriction endonuclease [Glutamicibacter ardleyensis]
MLCKSSTSGVDVTANGYVVQVKHYSNPVGPGPIREIAGVAHYLDQQPVFFSRSGYTAAAIAFGEHASVLMFTYNSDFGTATPVTALTRRSVDLSLGRPEL